MIDPRGPIRLRVPELLKERGWSISELMRRSWLSYPTVWRLAHGREEGSYDPVSLRTALALADAFGITVEDLIAQE